MDGLVMTTPDKAKFRSSVVVPLAANVPETVKLTNSVITPQQMYGKKPKQKKVMQYTPKGVILKLQAAGWKHKSSNSIFWKHPFLNVEMPYKEALFMLLVQQREDAGGAARQAPFSTAMIDAMRGEVYYMRKIMAAYADTANKLVNTDVICPRCNIPYKNRADHVTDCPIRNFYSLLEMSIASFESKVAKDTIEILKEAEDRANEMLAISDKLDFSSLLSFRQRLRLKNIKKINAHFVRDAVVRALSLIKDEEVDVPDNQEELDKTEYDGTSE
jgi:hypothetical protein